MDSEALKTFLTLRRAGSFSAAARALGRTQPAISRRIADLEAEVGARLFERTSAGVVLSQAGETLLPHAERALAALRDAADALAALRAGGAGPVSLAVVGTLAGAALGGVLTDFSAAHPGVELTLRTATSAEVSALVRRGEASIGLRYFDEPAPDLIAEPLGLERLVVVAAPGHRLAGRSAAGLADLKDERWLAFPDHFDRREVGAGTLFAEFLVRGVGEIAWTPVDSLTAQKRLAEASFGLMLAPESAVAEELAAGSLALIAVRDLAAANPVFAVTRRGGYQSPAALALLAGLYAKAEYIFNG